MPTKFRDRRSARVDRAPGSRTIAPKMTRIILTYGLISGLVIIGASLVVIVAFAAPLPSDGGLN